MKKIGTSVVSGAALLALSGTASAGPMSAASGQTVKPQTQVEQIAYRYHHRHYGWYRGRHYGWYRHRYYHRYGWNPGAAAVGAAVGLATLPFAVAGGWPYYGYYGYPYYGYRYGYPYYGYRYYW
jgi:hypothetical protein